MRRDEAFLLGAMAGVLVVWLWGPKLEHRVDEEGGLAVRSQERLYEITRRG
jgi:hypothetical protein